VVFLPCHLLLSVLVSIEQRNHLCHCLNLLYQLSERESKLQVMGMTAERIGIKWAIGNRKEQLIAVS
jgi:hypothetical protein